MARLLEDVRGRPLQHAPVSWIDPSPRIFEGMEEFLRRWRRARHPPLQPPKIHSPAPSLTYLAWKSSPSVHVNQKRDGDPDRVQQTPHRVRMPPPYVSLPPVTLSPPHCRPPRPLILRRRRAQCLSSRLHFRLRCALGCSSGISGRCSQSRGVYLYSHLLCISDLSFSV